MLWCLSVTITAACYNFDLVHAEKKEHCHNALPHMLYTFTVALPQ